MVDGIWDRIQIRLCIVIPRRRGAWPTRMSVGLQYYFERVTQIHRQGHRLQDTLVTIHQRIPDGTSRHNLRSINIVFTFASSISLNISRFTFPLISRNSPDLTQRSPQLGLFARHTIAKQIDCLSRQQRIDSPSRNIRTVISIVRCIHNQCQRSKQEMNQLRGIRIVNVRFQLGQQIKAQFEFSEYIHKLLLVRWLRSQRQQTLTGPFLFGFPRMLSTLQFAGGSRCMLQSGNELFDVVEAMVEHGNIPLVLLATGRAVLVAVSMMSDELLMLEWSAIAAGLALLDDAQLGTGIGVRIVVR